MILGINTHGLNGVEVERIVNDLEIKHVRYAFYVEKWLTNRQYVLDWTHHMRLAKAKGLKVCLVVHEVPADWKIHSLLDILEGIILTFNNCIEAIQIGNEKFFPGVQQGDHWAEIHAQCNFRIKEVNPEILVVSRAWPCYLTKDAQDFVASRPPMDAFAVHVYGWPLVVKEREGRGIMQNSDLFDIPLWYTEFGMDLHTIPLDERGKHQEWENVQAKEVEHFLLEAANYADRSYLYVLQSGDEEGKDETFGVYTYPESRRREVGFVIDSYLMGPEVNDG